jgi:Family of unknown function (DUF5367)
MGWLAGRQGKPLARLGAEALAGVPRLGVAFDRIVYEYEFMFMSLHVRLLRTGLVVWLGATLALRFGGQRILRPGDWKGALVLFAVTFPVMAWLVRRLCVRAGLPQTEWLAGAISLVLPTLMLDPFSSAFFPVVFPNMSPQVAGVFGGWMLCCCAGALAGVSFRLRGRITTERR